MKFLQIVTFYSEYLSRWYQQHPELASQSYDKQTEMLFGDGFAASHLFSLELKRFGCESRCIVANCEPMQKAWAREHGYEISGRNWSMEILKKQVDHYRPDILYCCDPITFDSRFIRLLAARPPLVVGWRAASIPAWSDFTEFDLFLSSDPVSPEICKKQGARATRHFLPGFPTWIADAVRGEPKVHDLVFCGQFSHEHMRRVSLAEQLSLYAQQTGDFSPAFFIHKAADWKFQYAGPFVKPERWGLDLYREIRRGRIGFNNVIDFAKGESGNMRQFEVTGCGTLLLTEYHDSLLEHFTPGREIETYASFEELVEKIKFYTNNDAAREEIAKRGQERCLREHGMLNRTQQLVDILSQFLGGIGCAPSTERIDSLENLLNSSAELISSNKVEESYRTALKALKHYPQARHVHYLLGLGLLKMQRAEEAFDAFSREVALFPDNRDAYELLSALERTQISRIEA
jgi:spore maturation protein CgeB